MPPPSVHGVTDFLETEKHAPYLAEVCVYSKKFLSAIFYIAEVNIFLPDTNAWRQIGCIPWNMVLKFFFVIVLLSAIIHSGLQVFQTKAKKAIGDNDYRKGYSSHRTWQMLWYCKLLALTFIPELTSVEFVAVVSQENVAISF